MTAHQGPRMSSRIKAQLNQQDTSKVAAATEKPLSATEGQEEAVSEPETTVLESSEQAETGSNLEAESVQNLDSKGELRCTQEDGFEAIPDAVFEPLTQYEAETFIQSPEVPQEMFDLAKALHDSAEQESGAKPLNLVDQAIETARKAKGTLPKPEQDRIDAAQKAVVEEYMPGTKMRFPGELLGMQSDGSLKVVLTITEEYIEGVEEAARTDGRTVDQWATERFQEYLEAYYGPAKSK